MKRQKDYFFNKLSDALTRTRLAVSVILLLPVLLAAGIPDAYYAGASGKHGETLQSALHGIISGQTVQTYTSLWTHFQTTDKKANGKVWDMYSGYGDGTAPYEFTFVVNQDGGSGGTSEGEYYNREHSFPKAWWGGSSSLPCYTDLFHLYPTDKYVNNQRSNYPFGETGNPSRTFLNGSKLGPCSVSGYSGTVYEPIDAYKGDFARTYFYMATRYYSEDSSWPGSDMVNGSQPKPWALAMLKTWAEEDPVSEKEIQRNEAVYSIQGNRNPFIDFPWYAGLIWGDLAPAPVNLSLDDSDPTAPLLTWDDVADNESGYRIYTNTVLTEELPANATSCPLTNLHGGDTLHISVHSLTAGGEVPSAELLYIVPELSRGPYRIMAYNTENYGESFPGDNSRNPYLRTIVSATAPDLLMLCEVHESNQGFEVLRDSVFARVNPEYAGIWINQSATQDIGLFYRRDLFDLKSSRTVNISSSSGLRDAFEARLKDKAYGREFLILGLHLKANDYTNNDPNIATRAAQALALRQYLTSLPDTLPFFVVGDFNMLNASEQGWQNLTGTQADNSGRLFDAPHREGEWDGNSAFADVHSWSASQLDTRFDFILHSPEVEDSAGITLVPQSFKVVGNDGNRYNGSVLTQPNPAASPELGIALINFSDHLPVLADYQFAPGIPDTGSVTPEPEEIPVIVEQNFESGWGDWSTVSSASNKDWTLDTQTGGARMSATAAYINGYGADTASRDWLISPSFSLAGCDTATFRGWINRRYTGDALAIYITTDSDISNPDAVSWVKLEDFACAGISSWTGWYEFDEDLSAWLGNETCHLAVLYTSSGTGSNDAAAYMVDEFEVTAGNTLTAVNDHPVASARSFRLIGNYPNPFNPSTNLLFQLPSATTLHFVFWDISGQRVDESRGSYPEGENSYHWTPVNLSSGIYFYRISDGHNSLTGRCLYLK